MMYKPKKTKPKKPKPKPKKPYQFRGKIIMEYLKLIREKFLLLPRKYQIAIGMSAIVILALIFG